MGKISAADENYGISLSCIRDAAADCTSGTLPQARATAEAEAWSFFFFSLWLPNSKHWQQSIGKRAGERAGNLPAGNRCLPTLRANTCLSNMASCHRWQQMASIYSTSGLLVVEDGNYIQTFQPHWLSLSQQGASFSREKTNWSVVLKIAAPFSPNSSLCPQQL